MLLLYGPSYLPALIPFWIILPGVTLAAAATTLGVFFQGIGRADLVAKIAFVPVLAQLSLGLLLVRHLQITGAALAFLAALLASTAIQIAVFSRLTGSSGRHTLIIRREDIATVWQFVTRLLGQVFARAHR
jgi:O-antigen/teichoic acid export membrane protein